MDRRPRPPPQPDADILVVAPYNAQVAMLARHLPDGARIGTVDKFQGQEAPVVFFSTAASSAADVPRGMEFLFSLNRLNVAISRARGLAVLVSSPTLLSLSCGTPERMRLANAFCRFVELGAPRGEVTRVGVE
jgi:superfamily I DNA and/or RNA helicase